MMRKTPASAMQKTYDECYLICSTAIYFEGQNNEAEALRAWRNALDQIYYHNAYKMPSSYMPRTETEKALQDSLRSMELQCKERVDLLQALKKSRQEAEEAAKTNATDAPSKSKESLLSLQNSPSIGQSSGPWLGQDTVPQARYTDIPKPSPVPERRPPPPPRPSYTSKRSSDFNTPRSKSSQSNIGVKLTPPSVETPRSRTPSPEKKSGGMLKTLRSNPKDRSSSGKMVASLRTRPPPAAAKAATQVWGGQQRPSLSANEVSSNSTATVTSWDPYTRSLVERDAARGSNTSQEQRRASDISVIRPPSPSEYKPRHSTNPTEQRTRPRGDLLPYPEYPVLNPYPRQAFAHSEESFETAKASNSPPPPVPAHAVSPGPEEPLRPQPTSLAEMGPSSISYMKEYPNHPPKPKKFLGVPSKSSANNRASDSEESSRSARTKQANPSPVIPRKAVGRASGVVSATIERQKLDSTQSNLKDRVRADPQAGASEALFSESPSASARTAKRKIENKPVPARAMTPTTDDSTDSNDLDTPDAKQAWENRIKEVMQKLPRGVDEAAARQIFNEIVIKGDEVHWDDVAGLEIAKSALKETVVYPFLRPDLFMGLREPARGMLLFGPPGTGKTMLARAVATESKSIFFAISASSLTSKFLGESEKLVRALFSIAKVLAPSIIFVDEIDSLLGSRGGGSEHEATRRIKTEFLIQWSDLQKAAAGRESTDGDATRVLVLAATNLPWAIDEAARRRFVRRQYIPLPEGWVREKQLRTLLSAQKHSLNDKDLQVLVRMTDGFSGSDITALAKDAAMGPLRSLGEKLLHMSPEDIRGIGMPDFEASLVNIRPSVSKSGLKEFEDWAREFGERGG